jgi:hypothetical protein
MPIWHLKFLHPVDEIRNTHNGGGRDGMERRTKSGKIENRGSKIEKTPRSGTGGARRRAWSMEHGAGSWERGNVISDR